LASWFTKDKFNENLTRPVNKSDFNFTNYTTRQQLRFALGYLVIRELPIKSFYIRSWITYFYAIYFLWRGLGRGFSLFRPNVVYN
jgi:hypothetical protein